MNDIDPPEIPYLDPSLWDRSKRAHLTFFSLGTILLFPAVLSFWFFWMFVDGQLGRSAQEEILLIGSSIVGSSAGVLAWTAMGLLFMKRSDARWQRACWMICAGFGATNLIASLCWIVSLLINHAPGLILFIMTAIAVVSLAASVSGWHFARQAARSCSRWTPSHA